MGYRAAGGNPKTLQKYASIWGISSDHFDPDAARNDALRRGRIPLDHILVKGSTYSRTHLKDRLFLEGLKDPVCEMCSQDENWRGERMAMILDHINGVHDDNRLENLRVLCPNCAATLDTHCGRKNLGAGRLQPRGCLRCGKTFRPQYQTHRYCSRECGMRWDRRGRTLRRARKTPRPPREQLLAEIHELGYLATGRKHGVTDNAIRKWIREYERERATAEGRDPSLVEIPRRTWPNMGSKRDAA
ncbi:MAG: HNH endonuclease signature motif containing protein [Solirubrobacterales bacterium]